MRQPSRAARTDDEHGERGAAPDGLFDLGVRGAGGVAEQDYDGAPGDAAGGIVGQESDIGHPGGAGEGGHDGAEERDPSAKEHRAAAAATEEVAGILEALLMPAQDAQLQDAGAEVAADFVADAVPDDGRGWDRDQDGPERDVAHLGGDAPEHGGGLTGHDEPDEPRVLDEHDQPHDQNHGPAWDVEDVREQGAHGRELTLSAGAGSSAGAGGCSAKTARRAGRRRSQAVSAVGGTRTI